MSDPTDAMEEALRWLTYKVDIIKLHDAGRPLPDDHPGRLAIHRLRTYPQALLCWRRLYSLPSRREFTDLVAEIGDIAFRARTESPPVTQKKSVALVNRATELARELEEILKNPVFGMSINDVLPEDYIAAQDRIFLGLHETHQLLPEEERNLDRKSPNYMNFPHFSREVEQRLNQAPLLRDGPPVAKDTSFAYRYCHFQTRGTDVLRHGLRKLASMIDQGRIHPDWARTSKRPDSRLGRQRSVAMSICWLLQTWYGTPMHGTSAELIEVVFDESIDVETVKKWWQRDRTKDLPPFDDDDMEDRDEGDRASTE